ncbi:UNVERIFIED_CONTAM: hypothetical protein H355_004102 [Colinus virginianus]|nr:hypothetical protein H355_004102 [Colinus virginianus]
MFLFLNVDRKDAEGWETVQRGRPVRPRSTVALATKAPVLAESLKSRGYSDKDNAVSPPSSDKPENSIMNDGASKSTELVEKDPLHQSERSLIEKTQLTAHTAEDNVSTNASLQEGSLQIASEAPPVLVNTDCTPAALQVNEASSAAAESVAQHPTEKAKTETEMDPSDISNVSAARWSMAEVLAKKEELADRLEKANEEAIASAIAEEEQLTREIEAEENNDINIETDNDSDFSEKDVRKWKEELLDQRRRMMEEKLLHAEFKREVQLQAIVKKAQEEEAKVNEIAFINTLEAQNKRHDVLNKLKEYEQRLNELQEERQRRQEEKQARDEAVQERKRALEAERQARVEELLLKRKEQEARIEQQRQEKEKAREDAARERARDREERLAALTAAQQEAMEELQKKIQLKHDESIRRHMEQIEQRKEKAAELSSGRHANTDYAPKLTPYERKKQCSLCNVMVS